MDENKLDYFDILEAFGEERISDRCNWLKDLMIEFIKHNQLGDSVSVSDAILYHVIVDYFADIKRLKEFQNIEKTNNIKIFAYTTYWLLRHKPLQVKESISEENVFINERFCSEFVRTYLFDNPSDISILKNNEKAVCEFIETMLYYFKYRDVNPQCIELMLIAFEAGRGYQDSVDHQS